MATINIETLQTINKDVSGYWQSRTCPPTSLSYSGVITAGEPCSVASGGIYNDDNNNCFECVGYSRTEVRTLVQGTTTVYVKCYVSFDENGGTTVGNRYVYFGTDGTTSRTYGQYASLPTSTRSGYTFNGWFTASSGGTQITNTTAVSSSVSLNQTLYAQWTQDQQQTATPTILSAQQGSFPFLTQGFRVRNNDGSTATIYAEANDSTPDVNRGSVGSGLQTSFISLGCQSGNCNDTVYAKAQASGETMSATTSLYIQ
jgi:uncharacterized repeat protein (TIGR02543 family)